jgi:hypothetical protein
MYVNAKTKSVETILGIRGMGERSVGGNSNMVYLIHYKNLCKYYNVPPHSTIKKNKEISITIF